MATRRDVLKFGALAGLAGSVTPAALRLADLMAAAEPTPVAKYAVPLTVPPVLDPVWRSATTDYYAIVTRSARREILPGTTTDVLTYNGTFPGPTIRARSGRPVVVQQVNTLDRPTSMHLHGGSVSERDDGGTPAVAIPARGTRTYRYPNQQPAATLWMHDHTHQLESEHVYRGLSGQYLIGDEHEDSLGLPSGEFDVPLVLRDGAFDATGTMLYTLDDAEFRTTILVNGRPWPYMPVAGRRYRFRVINASNLRFFVLRLANGGPITHIGSDGGLLPAPVAAPVVVLSPGERADLVIDFSRYAAGTQIVLQNLIGPGPADRVGTVMRFDVGAPVADPSVVPAVLTPLPAAPVPVVDRSFVLRMDEAAAPATHAHGGPAPATTGHATINGATHDPNRIDTTVAWGTTERWTITNASASIPHNFHTHLVPFRVLDRDGKPPPPAESGLKDTVQVFPGESVTLLLTFDTFRGVFPYHCHMIDHSAMGMMGQLRVV